jgi:hypothetical protein
MVLSEGTGQCPSHPTTIPGTAPRAHDGDLWLGSQQLRIADPEEHRRGEGYRPEDLGVVGIIECKEGPRTPKRTLTVECVCMIRSDLELLELCC